MKSTDAPSKQAVPFGSNGPREAITATTPSGSNQASYDQGFPPITMTLKSAGGLPPKGQDMNQILFEQSSFNRYFAAGGGYVYDSAFSTAVGGYPSGALIPFSDSTGYWLNTVDGNTINPENTTSALTGWVPAASAGFCVLSGLSSSGVSVGTLNASRERIVLYGTLTSNINILLPAWVKKWDIVNNTTGSFAVTVKTPSGTGVAIPSGRNAIVFGDGTNITTGVTPGALLNVQVFTSSGTYTPTTGTKRIRVRLVGGGGGGGGTAATAANQIASSFGGGAGTYGDTGLIDAAGITTVQVVVGTGGASKVAGNGNNGGASSFGSYITAPGGYGGDVGFAGSAGTTGSDTQTSDACTGSNVLIYAPGKGGTAPFNITTTGAGVKAGAGGASMFSPGGRAFNGLVSSTESAKGYGGGGSGIAAGNNAVTFMGGSGSSGIVIVEEYA